MFEPCSQRLERENRKYRGTGGRSEENAVFGFRPAFRDDETGIVYGSSFSDGRPAPFHLLDGLPEEVITARNGSGRITGVKDSLVSGFVQGHRFFTRDEACAWLSGSQESH